MTLISSSSPTRSVLELLPNCDREVLESYAVKTFVTDKKMICSGLLRVLALINAPYFTVIAREAQISRTSTLCLFIEPLFPSFLFVAISTLASLSLEIIYRAYNPKLEAQYLLLLPKFLTTFAFMKLFCWHYDDAADLIWFTISFNIHHLQNYS